MDKVVASAAEAVADLRDGAVIGVSGFGVTHGFPVELIAAGADLGLRDLTIVCNSLGRSEEHPFRFALRGQVRKLIAAFSARAGGVVQSAESIGLEVELVPQGVLVERLRAAGAGIGPFYSPVAADTILADGREVRTFDRDYVLEYPLHLDVAFIYAAVADRSGNLSFRGTNQNFGPSFAKAAKITIAEVDEIVETGELAPEAVDLPGVFVDRVVWSGGPRQPSWRPHREQHRRQYGDRYGRSPAEIGARIAELLPEPGYVNLGVGLPIQVSDYLHGRDITLHGENGVLGYTERLSVEQADPNAFNAGGEPVRLADGAAVFDSVEAFEIARGGHLSAVVLGAFQVDSSGSFANWTTPEMGGGAIGGAMDLVANPGKLIIAMHHVERSGKPKIVNTVEYPVTGSNCVDLIVTDLAVIERDERGLVLRETAPGFDVDDIVSRTGAPLHVELWT